MILKCKKNDVIELFPVTQNWLQKKIYIYKNRIGQHLMYSCRKKQVLKNMRFIIESIKNNEQTWVCCCCCSSCCRSRWRWWCWLRDSLVLSSLLLLLQSAVPLDVAGEFCSGDRFDMLWRQKNAKSAGRMEPTNRKC